MDWKAADRYLIGESWVGSQIDQHLQKLCVDIGPRWAGSPSERSAAEYIRDAMAANGLSDASLEEFPLKTWSWESATLSLIGSDRPLDILPFNHCEAIDVEAPLVDVGFGTRREVTAARDRLAGAVALMNLTFEQFSAPEHHGQRLQTLADAGAVGAIVIDPKDGRRMEYHSGADWRNVGYQPGALPTVTTSREHGGLLRSAGGSGAQVALKVDGRRFETTGTNTVADMVGAQWPDEILVLAGHHDTVINAPGGNDNGSGTVTVMEVARVMQALADEFGIRPGRTIRFGTWSGEEQGLQGAYAHVARHWPLDSDAPLPRLNINLDELSTATVKGLVLTFPHLRDFVQAQLDDMGGGYRCHVMGQLDANSDHFPFARRGIDASMCWRWRYAQRNPDADFHHEPGDTIDKVRPRELHEYVAFLSRLLLRLSLIPPQDWPENPVSPESVEQRLRDEIAQVVRVN
jgi:hypothetical protein